MTSEQRDVTILVTWSKNLILKNANINKNIVFMKMKFMLLNSIFNYLSNKWSISLHSRPKFTFVLGKIDKMKSQGLAADYGQSFC